jgi:hypothetical protein
MFSEVNQTQRFLKEKFGENVPAGTYPIPTTTSKGDAFMKVTVSPDGHLSGFYLYWDEEFKYSWYDTKKPKKLRK